MASIGPNAVSNAFNNTSAGTTAWVGPSNVYTSNSVYATNTEPMTFTSGSSNKLVANTLGFSIPTDATINGITVNIVNISTATFTQTTYVELSNGSSTTANNGIGTAKSWTPPTTLSTTTMGGGADLWGATLTPTLVNSSTFGVGLYIQSSFCNNFVWSVDSITITVAYTPSAGGPVQYQVITCGL